MPERYTEYLPVESLVPAAVNAKAHDLSLIDKSLSRFGLVELITLDERTGRIISGHGRREQLIEMRTQGKSPPEGVQVDAEGSWLVPVQRGWASETDAEATAAGIALNRVGEKGGWRQDVLTDVLMSLQVPDIESLISTDPFDGVGFTPTDLDELMTKFRPSPPKQFPEVDPDELAIEHVCPKCGYEWSGNPS